MAWADGHDRKIATRLDLRKVLVPERSHAGSVHDGLERHWKLACGVWGN
jgi:hypothetical protein